MNWLKNIFVLLLFYSNILNSQSFQYKGKIIDELSQEPLAFVNIIYGKGNLGTTTNIDGTFYFTSKNLIDSIKISYLGYKTKTTTINPTIKDEINILKIKPLVYNLNEAVVLPGENPAHRIIRQTIMNKDINNPEKLESFSYTSYNRMHFTFQPQHNISPKIDSIKISTEKAHYLLNKNRKSKFLELLDNQHIFLMESVSERVYNGPGKNKETVLASKTSGLKQPYMVLLATQFQSFSIYGEEIELGSRKYVSPVCRSCINHYLYIIEDTLFNEKNDTLFVISFRPQRGKNFDGLKGVMHINSNRYAIENIRTEPVESDTMLDLRIQQRYAFIENTTWFPIELNTDIIFKSIIATFNDSIVINDSLAIIKRINYAATGIGKSYLDLIQVNPIINNKKFGHIEVELAKNAGKANADYFAPFRPDSLSEKDINTYRMIDSIGEALNLDNKIRILSVLMTGYIPWKFLNFDLNRLITFNEYEGFRAGVGFKTNNKLASWFSLESYVAWGFKDKEAKYGYGASINLPNNEEVFLRYRYSYDTREPGQNGFIQKRNISNTEFFRQLILPSLDYNNKYELSGGFRFIHYANAEVFLNKNNLSSNSNFEIINSPNTAQNKFSFTEAGIKIRYAYREKFFDSFFGKISMGTKWPILQLSLSQGIKTLNGEYNYNKNELQVQQNINFRFSGITNYTVRLGHINGMPPINLLFNGYGSNAPFSADAENTFQTMYPYEFFSSEYAHIFIRHNLGSLLFKKGKFKPGISLCHNMGIGKINNTMSSNNSSVKTMEKTFIESGIIFSNILKSGFSGIGIGGFYRYGYYSYNNFWNNANLKMSLTFNL